MVTSIVGKMDKSWSRPLKLRFIFSVTYRLGLFNTTSATNVNLVHGHDADDPLLDHVDEDALVTGHSVHVLVDPVSGSSI